jgi:hypothetical protein
VEFVVASFWGAPNLNAVSAFSNRVSVRIVGIVCPAFHLHTVDGATPESLQRLDSVVPASDARVSRMLMIEFVSMLAMVFAFAQTRKRFAQPARLDKTNRHCKIGK